MKRVSELNGRHAGADIYVVGTGASLRVFPLSFFDDKITIGLNMTWKVLPSIHYCITIHPDLNVPEFMPERQSLPNITWIVGERKSRKLLTTEQWSHAERHHYMFDYYGQPNTAPDNEPSTSGRMLDWLRRPTGDNLYVWSSISQAGVNLAANMGAKNIILVGCDNCALGDNHHAHHQHTRWKGADPNHRYRQYYEGLAEIREVLRGRGIHLVSMNPLLTLGDTESDFLRLCREVGVPTHIHNHDLAVAAKPAVPAAVASIWSKWKGSWRPRLRRSA